MVKVPIHQIVDVIGVRRSAPKGRRCASCATRVARAC